MQAETVALVITIVVAGLGSSLATIRILLHQMGQMEIRLTDQIKENGTAIKENRALIMENRAAIGENRALIMENRAAIKENGTAIKENRALIMENRAQIVRNSAKLDDHSRLFHEGRGELRDLSGETQKVREGLARVEGFLMGPGGFKLNDPDPPAGN